MDESTATAAIDELYEFSAPCFFDFMKGESEEETRNAELWFETALSYAPSPFMVRIKSGSRNFQVVSLSNVDEEDQMQKAPESSDDKPQAKLVPDEVKEEIANDDEDKENIGTKKLVSDKKHQTAKKITSTTRNSSVLKPKTSNAGTPNLALESQAIKRQKLDGGRSRQILNVKPHNLPHKSKLGLSSGSSNLSSSTAKLLTNWIGRFYVREQPAPFVSFAEMMNKFQSCTRDLSLPHSSLSNVNKHIILALTKDLVPGTSLPKEPEFETAQRVRPITVKSTAELEEEMMAKIPTFRNLFSISSLVQIFEASTPLPSLPRSTPKPPEFQEFHLETMARASKNVETPSSVTSTEVSHQNNQWKPQLTDPKSPVLQTSLRAKPPKVKSSIELEQEELEKAPKFKARPLNKKIFESKGEMGIFCNATKQVTIPPEFHFATHERIPPPIAVFDIFDKLSLIQNLLIHFQETPFPIHSISTQRYTSFLMRAFEEERARVPKANPYPYTTDYPVVPPKPEPKQCTKPEPFQLESLVRHEEEMKREMEERKKKEKEEAQMRLFKAQPVLKEDPIPVPEKVRKPLTQVEEFDLHLNNRAVDRAEFDQKIKEKEMIYKRYREETEAARMIEEEKALKQLRRTMVPHARPVPKFDHPFCPQRYENLLVFQGNTKPINYTASTSSPKNSKDENDQFTQHTNFQSGHSYEMISVSGNRVREALPPPRPRGDCRKSPPPPALHQNSNPSSPNQIKNPMDGSSVMSAMVIDEFKGESEEEARKAELWFETALSYGPSPFMARIKGGSRSVHVESLCNFNEEDQMQKASESSDAPAPNNNLEDKPKAELVPDEVQEEVKSSEAQVETNQIVTEAQSANDDKDKENTVTVCAQENGSAPTEKSHLNVPGDEDKGKSAVQVKLSRQILNVKPHNLTHKSKLGLTSGSSNRCSSTAKNQTNWIERTSCTICINGRNDEKVSIIYQRFVTSSQFSVKFLTNQDNAATVQMPTLKLTRPKEPEFETAQRTRPFRVKSAAELEEEMMAKIPKFKARPLNKKIFVAPTLPSLPRSTPKPPEFQEFHLETMARASKNAETSSVASTEVSRQNNQWKPHLTEPKTPVLQTSLRARPIKVKSSIELEQEELEKAPKFKARPLNKKIFESKGELGIFCNAKKQVTIPQEFHFATHERVPPPASVFDLFDKLSLNSESNHDPIPRKNHSQSIPSSHRGKRGKSQGSKGYPYPYTTDYPVVPPKPEPKHCTKPEPFPLESLVRHEEEMKREMEERRKKEKEEAQMRIFKAQPVLKEDPIPVPEKARKPLTQVQEFDLHVNHRAVERAEFDQKIKEKEMIYKRYREETEAARMIEEEKALKQLRRTMVPHARPVPKFDHPFCPQKSSKETTKPKSPHLRVLQRIERKKRIGSLAAPTSSPATLMR
ncbi:hypothetical protein GQ457_01G000280 [Hibiscus cannabinus]